MRNYRIDHEVRAITRRELIHNLLAMAACLVVGSLVGVLIGLSLRFH